MTTEIKIQTEVPRRLQKLAIQYRKEVLIALSEHIDHIRLKSLDYIIPRDPSIPSKEMRSSILRRLQPSNPLRLTHRTGALKRMLVQPHTWRFTGQRVRRSDGDAVFGVAKVATKGSKIMESYQATMELKITNARKFSTAATPQQLMLRFKHDTPGIRGRRRLFYTDAAYAEEFHLSPLVEARLRFLGVL